jgi:hypothetical protein
MPGSSRPAPPYPPERGKRWVPDLAADARTIDEETGERRDRKCSARRAADRTRVNPCNAKAVALVQDNYRCANHLDGRWIDAGVVLVWVLEPIREDL